MSQTNLKAKNSAAVEPLLTSPFASAGEFGPPSKFSPKPRRQRRRRKTGRDDEPLLIFYNSDYKTSSKTFRRRRVRLSPCVDGSQSQGRREHILDVGANHRGEESIFLMREPITGEKRAYS
eukprot:7334485-Pyramimonas_sp.AAC.1